MNKLWEMDHGIWPTVWPLILCCHRFVLQNAFRPLHVNLFKETKGYGTWMQHAVYSMKASGSQGQQPTVLPHTVKNLLHQQGLSALQIESQRLSVWEQISLSTALLEASWHKTSWLWHEKGITPDSLLIGMGECVCVHSSQSKMMLLMHRAHL